MEHNSEIKAVVERFKTQLTDFYTLNSFVSNIHWSSNQYQKVAEN